jgi:hypothetical protein
MEGIQASGKIVKTMSTQSVADLGTAQNEGTTKFVKRTRMDCLVLYQMIWHEEKKWDTPFETIMAAEKHDETSRNNQVARKSIPTCWPNNSPFSKLEEFGLATTSPR